jgi:hypothetical protein
LKVFRDPLIGRNFFNFLGNFKNNFENKEFFC